jgi:hypothetical protein
VGDEYRTVYFFTETGFMNTAVYAEVMKIFTSIWQKRRNGEECVLLGDNLAIHRDDEVGSHFVHIF